MMSAGEKTSDNRILREISLVITKYLCINKGTHIFTPELLAEL